MKELTGLIFDIRRFSLHDGPGIRTTVFFKGCPMRCKWCHNPESRLSKAEAAFYMSKCINCGKCAEICPTNSIISDDTRINRETCAACGKCADVCPSEALRLIGREMTVSEVIGEVVCDEQFYRKSGGGVTLSGGEPLFQPEFTLRLLKAAREKGLHTVIETCGYGLWQDLSAVIQLTDLFLFDLKIIDNKKHKRLCGVESTVILENARRLSASGASVVFRTPIIPGLNDNPDDIHLLGEFILSLPCRHKLELIPYHKIGTGKYEALGLAYPLPDTVESDNLDKQKSILASMKVETVDH